MALSQQEFEKLKAKLGGTTAQTPIQPDNGMTLDKNPIKQFGTDVVTNVIGSITSAGEKISQNADKYAGKRSIKNLALNVAHDVGAISGGVVGALAAPISTAIAPVAKPVVSAITQTDTAQALKVKIDEWTKENPEKAALIGDSANLASFLALGLVPSTNIADIHPVDTTKQVMGTVGGDIKSGAETVGGVFGKGITKVAPSSEGIMQRVARIPKGRQIAFEKTAGESVGSYLDKRGIYGNTEDILTKLSDRFITHRNLADSEIAKLPGKYQATPIKTALTQLMEREKNVSSPGVLSPDFKEVQGLLSKYNKGGLNMSEVNQVKRLFERNVKLGYQKTLGTNPDVIARATNLDSALRKWQFTKAEQLGLKNLGEINKETRLARQLLDDLGKESAGIGGNNALGLTDAILVSGGDPAAIAMLITKKGLGSKTVQSKVAEMLSKNKEKIGTVSADIGVAKPTLQDFMNAKPSTPLAGQVSGLSSPNTTPLSPEVQRILNLRQ